MTFLLDKDSLEAALQEMPDPLVPTIERLRVDAIEKLHPTRQVGIRRLDEQVIVVAHQAVGMADPAVPHNHIAQHLQKPVAILIVEEDSLQRVAKSSNSSCEATA